MYFLPDPGIFLHLLILPPKENLFRVCVRVYMSCTMETEHYETTVLSGFSPLPIKCHQMQERHDRYF